ncbi:amidase [Halobacillus litoralis]|uniref:amidase family protein n=1 Tax=Halobacillus litoralis TaxID=45668 RepID=UPI001CD1AD6E|nr:amidase family protein [Halobacillus litoralis]MCA0969275.1 amidase [Halobacillus litoralis]
MKDWYNDVSSMQAALTNGQTSSRELTLTYLKRIAEYDQQGAAINSVAEINPDAVHIAEALDQERKLKGIRGPLHGIPVIVKDNIDTGDKMHTTAGSIALKDHYADKDAFVASQLRKAGAVIIGKANLTEWANFMSEAMPNGYSSRGGQVLNPYAPGTFDVGGSSSGSAAAVASYFAAAAIGTETSGSILSPASRNSLVGVKPTVGLVSRLGIIPISHSQDTAGPITRTVKDAALLLEALVGVDPKDPATAAKPGHISNLYTMELNTFALQHARIGVDRTFLQALNEEEAKVIDQAIEDLKKQGAEVIDVSLPVTERESSVMFHEFKHGVNAYLATCAPHIPVHTLNELIVFHHQHEETALKYGQSVLMDAEKTNGRLTDPAYLLDRLEDLRASQADGLDAVKAEYQLDAFLSPNELGSQMPAIAGYPSITVPAGYTETEGKPVGLTLTGGAYEEGKLLSLAYHYEQTRSTTHKAPTL